MVSYEFTTESGGVYRVDEGAKTFGKVVPSLTDSLVPTFEGKHFSWLEVRGDPYEGEFTRIDRRPEAGEQVLFQNGKIHGWVRTGVIVVVHNG